MSNVRWTQDQLRAIETRGSSVLVSAAAGSGKTAVLVERLLRRIVDERLDITQFLIITYTKAAASELRRKISDALYARAAENPGDRHIRRQLALVGSARISTVHSFCTWLLKNFGGENEAARGFRVLDENESRLMLEEMLAELCDEKYEERDEAFLSLAGYLSGARNDKPLFAVLLEMYDKSVSHPYPHKWLSAVSESYNIPHGSSISDTVWGRYAHDAAKKLLHNAVRTLDFMIADVEKDAAASELYADFFIDERAVIASSVCDDWDEMRKKVLAIKFKSLPPSKKIEDKVLVSRIKAARDNVKAYVGDVCNKFLSEDSEVLVSELLALYPHLKQITALVCELSERFKKEKLRRAVLDYSDLEHLAIDLLIKDYDEESDTVIPTEKACEVAAGFCEILLDEFQDSNNVQDIIFRAVSRDEKNIVMVGDVKQSIYRFRLADPSIFMRKYKAFKRYEDATGDEPRCITLAQNFRSRAEVLDASNALFECVMTEALGGVDYDENQRLVPRDEIPDSERNDMACEFHLIDRINYDGMSGSLAEATFCAAKISELVKNGFEIYDKDNGKRPVRYRDFAILLRSAAGNAEIYEQMLKKFNIPFISPRTEGLLQKSEVNAIVSFLSVIDNPTSDIPLLAVLKSPLFAFTADDLCHIRRSGDSCLFNAMEVLAKCEGETAEKCRSFLTLLSGLRSASRGMNASALIWELYNRTNALGMFGALSYGEERQRNLIEFYKSAQGFENSGYSGLYGFISHIAGLAERGGDIPAPAAHTANAVTIMTIHKSKGLEFPVVMLSGSIRNFNTDDIRRPVLIHPEFGAGLKYRDEDLGCECSTLARDVIANVITEEMKSEEMRILYVAMTRAREKLYIVASHNNAAKMIEKTVAENAYPELLAEALRERMGTQDWFMMPLLASSGGNRLLEYANLYERSGGSLGGIEAYITNELPSCECEDESVTEESDENIDFSFAAECFEYSYPHKTAALTPSKLTATGITSAKREGFTPVRRTFPRPGFMREKSLTPAERGTALHMAMQFSDFRKCQTLDGVRDELCRLQSEKYLTAKQAEAVDAEKIFAFVTSDIGRDMLCARDVRREFKFSVLLPAEDILENSTLCNDKILLQGVMDMYYENDAGITIVDFKTDRRRPQGETLRKYEEQLRAYQRALYEMTGKHATRLVLYLISLGEYMEV